MKNWIKHKSGVHLIHLSGSRIDRARQHGEVIKSFGKPTALGPLAEKNRALIAHPFPKPLRPILVPLVAKLYTAIVSGQVRLFGPRASQQELQAIHEVTGLPKSVFLEALTQPDWMMILAALVNPRFARDLPGCSSIVMPGHRTERGNILHGRNMDYPAAGYWEKNPAVMYHEPYEPGTQPYVAISSLGIHTPGLTGMNASGLTIGVHAHFAKKISLKGMPIFFLGQSILEHAKNINDAIELARKFPVMGNWTYVVSSAFENRAVAIELYHGQVHVREASEYSLCHSNNFHHTEFSHEEIELCGAIHLDMVARFESLHFKSREKSQLWTESDIAQALGSHRDPFLGSQHIYGNTVSVVTTIKTAIMEPALQRLFLSVRNESPVGLGPYVELPLRWDSAVAAAHEYADRASEPLNLVPELDPEFTVALHHYHNAYVSWQVPGSKPTAAEDARDSLRQATDALTTDPHLWIQRGIFELKLSSTVADAEIARSCFQSALRFSIHPHLKHVAQIFLARCLDLLGHRNDALQLYKEVEAVTRNKKTKKHACRGLKSPYSFKQTWRIDPDMQFVEPIDY